MKAIQQLIRKFSSGARIRAGVSPFALAAMLVALVPQCLFGCGMNATMAPPALGIAAPMDCCDSACPMDAAESTCDTARSEIAPATVAQQADVATPHAVAAASAASGATASPLTLTFAPDAPRFAPSAAGVPLHLLHSQFLI